MKQTFETVSNRTALKRTMRFKLASVTFETVSNRTVPKPRNSPFSFQQLTINISSPIVVARAFARHCGSN